MLLSGDCAASFPSITGCRFIGLSYVPTPGASQNYLNSMRIYQKSNTINPPRSRVLTTPSLEVYLQTMGADFAVYQKMIGLVNDAYTGKALATMAKEQAQVSVMRRHIVGSLGYTSLRTYPTSRP